MGSSILSPAHIIQLLFTLKCLLNRAQQKYRQLMQTLRHLRILLCVYFRQGNPQDSELCLTSTNINIHFYLHGAQVQWRVTSLERGQFGAQEAHTCTAHTQQRRQPNLHKDNYLTVDWIRVPSRYLLQSLNAFISFLWVLNKLFTQHLHVPGTLLSTRENMVGNKISNVLSQNLWSSKKGQQWNKQHIKNTCYERNTAQGHRAGAVTLSLKRSQPHTSFYLLFLKFIPLMSSYNV